MIGYKETDEAIKNNGLALKRLFVVLKIFGLGALFSGWAITVLTFVNAYFSGNWMVLVDVNYYGEGYAELFIALITVPIVLFLFYDFVRRIDN